MGKWNYRRARRSFYHQYKDPASSYYDSNKPPPPLPDYSEDGIPSWEKKFCTLIGSVPWQKIVNVKEYIFCHDKVANWDDSAGKEAFQSAKRHFWEEINGISSQQSFPDPDMYIDEVNWNSNIDRELIEDLERSLFVPEEGEEDNELDCRTKNKNTTKIISAPEESGGSQVDIRTPAECNKDVPNSVAASEKKVQGWNQWPNSTDKLRNNDNPWDSCVQSGNEAEKGNTWGNCSSRIKLQGWNKSEENASQSTDWNKCTVNNEGNNPWEQSFSQNQSKDLRVSGNPWKCSNWGTEEKTWGNSGCNQWERNFTQRRGNVRERQWRGNGRNESSWRWSGDQFREPKDSRSRQPSRNWGSWTESHRKREGNHQYATSNKHCRFEESNYRKGHQWR